MVLPACEKMGLVQAAYWSVFVQVSPKEQQPWGLKKIRTPWIDGDPIFWWIFFFIPWMRFEQLIWWLGSKKYLKVFKQWNSIARKWLDTILIFKALQKCKLKFFTFCFKFFSTLIGIAWGHFWTPQQQQQSGHCQLLWLLSIVQTHRSLSCFPTTTTKPADFSIGHWHFWILADKQKRRMSSLMMEENIEIQDSTWKLKNQHR